MKVLLSKPDSLGDQFIAAGSVQALARLRPEIQLVWHVRAGMEAIAPLIGADVFTPNPDAAPETEAARLGAQAGRLILLPYPLSPYEAWTNEIRTRVGWWVAFLRATKWDASILGLVNRNWVGDLTVAAAPAAQRIGYAAGVTRQPLMNEAGNATGPEAPTFTTPLAPSFTRNESAQIRDLFAAIEPRLGTIEPPPLWQPLVRSPGFSRNPSPPEGGTTSPSRILIAPGVGGDARRAWGLKRFTAVAEALQANGASITWIEGPGDAAHLEGIPANARVRFGSADLGKLVDALRDADLLICHDTAYVHIAAGVGVPAVAIYGAGQHHRFHPAGGRIKVIHSQIACAGCQWHCLWDRLVCVADIPVATVIAAARQMLAGEATPVVVPLATPVASAPGGEPAGVQRRLQEEILALDSDRFARLQIIQSLLAFQQSPARTFHSPSQ